MNCSEISTLHLLLVETLSWASLNLPFSSTNYNAYRQGKDLLAAYNTKDKASFGAKFGQVFQQTLYKRLGFPKPWVPQL